MSASAPDRTCEYGDADQCPNDRNPIFFTGQVYEGRPGRPPKRALRRSALASARSAGWNGRISQEADR
jgi:hypothetical protein